MLITTLLLVTLGQYDPYQQQYENQQYQNQQYRYEAQQQAAQSNFEAQNKLRALQYKSQLDAVKAQATSSAAKKKAQQTQKEVECHSAEFDGPFEPVAFAYDPSSAMLETTVRSPDGAKFTLKVKFERTEQSAHTRVAAAGLSVLSSSNLSLIAAGWKRADFSKHNGRLRAHFSGLVLFDATEDGRVARQPSECVMIKNLVLETLRLD